MYEQPQYREASETVDVMALKEVKTIHYGSYCEVCCVHQIHRYSTDVPAKVCRLASGSARFNRPANMNFQKALVCSTPLPPDYQGICSAVSTSLTLVAQKRAQEGKFSP